MTDERRGAKIVADFLIDDYFNCDGALTYFGRWQDASDTYPMAFIRDGGSVEINGEYGKMVVHGRHMAKAEVFPYRDSSGSYEFVMTRLIDETVGLAP